MRPSAIGDIIRAKTTTCQLRNTLISIGNYPTALGDWVSNEVTIRMGVDIIEYFKRMSEDTGIPYQNLINLYLRECVQSGRKISIKWAS